MRAIVSRARQIILTTVVIAAFLLCTPIVSICQAANAHLSLIAQDIDTPGKITLVIDKVEKLAGMKVIITYDKDQLSFVRAEKGQPFSSFMHVVNDKTPGTLIIVMASAGGVSGTNLPLVHLTFSSNAHPSGERVISVSYIQLMNADLQEISGDQPQYVF
ncbi:cohesin domain-containing protein [bacterium]|nr:cohesin domain-containing protein [bacterium]